MQDFVKDDKGNIATVSYWGSIEAAEKSLTTLTDCNNCYNCHKCNKCNDCNNCYNCAKQPSLNTPTNLWAITIRQDKTMKIGCQDHSLETWLNLSDNEISAMHRDALNFWKFWKPIVSQFA